VVPEKTHPTEPLFHSTETKTGSYFCLTQQHNGHYVNPFEEWQDVTVYETLVHWIARLKGNGIPYDRKVKPCSTPILKEFVILYIVRHLY